MPPNEKHLRILNNGIKAWNDWREKTPQIIPDLQDAELYGKNLRTINFHDTLLRRANLISANLNYASLFGANLAGAKLNGATLIEANLGVAELSYSELINANLRKAYCAYANFSHSNLDGATLESATFDATIFGDTNLSNVKGLDSCRHNRPSILDHSTLTQSGRLPLNFLRGCGLPDTLIEYIPSLLHNPIQFYSCFISYSSKDHMFVNRLYADLQNKGVRCWLAKEDLKIGDKFRHTIDDSIRIHDKLLLILSKTSVASHWVEKEVETAMEQEVEQSRTVLFPIRLDNAIMDMKSGWPADIKRARHIGDFSKWRKPEDYQKAFERLLRDLKAARKQQTADGERGSGEGWEEERG